MICTPYSLYKTQVSKSLEYCSHLWDCSANHLLDAVHRLQRSEELFILIPSYPLRQSITCLLAFVVTVLLVLFLVANGTLFQLTCREHSLFCDMGSLTRGVNRHHHHLHKNLLLKQTDFKTLFIAFFIPLDITAIPAPGISASSLCC